MNTFHCKNMNKKTNGLNADANNMKYHESYFSKRQDQRVRRLCSVIRSFHGRFVVKDLFGEISRSQKTSMRKNVNFLILIR